MCSNDQEALAIIKQLKLDLIAHVPACDPQSRAFWRDIWLKLTDLQATIEGTETYLSAIARHLRYAGTSLTVREISERTHIERTMVSTTLARHPTFFVSTINDGWWWFPTMKESPHAQPSPNP